MEFRCPECEQGKCANCTGWALSELDNEIACECACQRNVRRCRICRCTDDRACLTPTGPCHWIEQDLCSACPRQLQLDGAVP